MTLPVDVEDDEYRFYKTLNEDVQLTPNQYHKYDLHMENGDYVNVIGRASLYNAIVIAIMTRFNELFKIPVYENFGCRCHELVKKRKSTMTEYEIKVYVEEVLNKMRRIKSVDEIEVTDAEDLEYKVNFSVTSINDEIVAGSVEI